MLTKVKVLKVTAHHAWLLVDEHRVHISVDDWAPMNGSLMNEIVKRIEAKL